MSMKGLKKELEAALLITDWSPTESDLREIALQIKGLKGKASKLDIEKIVSAVVGPYEYMILGGVDNTDLTTLLLLATKTTD
ncbi:hypothetical protein [Rheinheimera texasensis]|uniref:hypothetical protein n=1 Tax=Rheinheimera texasensis TaxID=306205 RepID=UPI0032B2F307